MFAAVQRDHLAGHRAGGQDIADAGRDLFRGGAMLQRGRVPLHAEMVLVLPLALQRRSRSDGVDPDARRQRQRQCLGQCPQPRLRQRIGNKIGGEVPHSLVQQIDNDAFRLVRQGARHALRQQERGAQIGLHMDVPAFARRRVPDIVFEARGIVHQAAHRPQRLGRAADQACGFVFAPKVGRQGRGAPSHAANLRRQFLRRLARPAIVDRQIEALFRQVQRDGATDTMRRARDQGRARDGTCRGRATAQDAASPSREFA